MEGGVHCCGLGLNTMLFWVWESVESTSFGSCNSETSFDLPVCFGTLHATIDSTCASIATAGAPALLLLEHGHHLDWIIRFP
ncbi:hypothetical protein PAHAL_5G525900 [Panicum hallii]|uniref:Uncharacterized protein n=1 Tax=Panicum hallii TaxID=206008 RepID=A0A2T8IPC2_9POAL|nr:hypothetical protein PAHAL_5G525900 [Panicum hallii]